jgi:endonuclease/exonuclease/phosphatase (EEP) superfamily protein YafD
MLRRTSREEVRHMRRGILAGSMTIVTFLMLVAGSPATAQAPATNMELRVMTFNIWLGAAKTDLGMVVEAIEAADADVVGMQEPFARLRKVAKALGFYVSPRTHVISRYPILEPEGTDGDYAYLLLAPGQVAVMANTHLPCCPYTPYRIVHKGMDRAAALRQEQNTRVRRIAKQLAPLQDLLEAGVPTFFTGDFNTPSWRDWTRAAIKARDLPYAIRWPVSLEMEAAGFVDSYRAALPDPVADPGFTWTSGYPPPFVYPGDVFDRIDFVWAAGSVETLASGVVGESRANADIVVRPYPSDHRAVVSTFEVTPAPAPVFVSAAGERSRLGEALDVWFHAPGEAGEHLVLRPAGSDVPVAELPIETADGSVAFETAGLEQGTYDVVLADAADAELARDTVVLVAEGQLPILTVADDTLEGNQKLEVSWSYAPGNKYDWLGVYQEGVPSKARPCTWYAGHCTGVGYLKAWRYMDAKIDGHTRIGPGVRGAIGWPLPPGRYDVRICLDDSNRCRVSTTFEVVG